ncbi:MAG TPA: outer membrane beta-barrel protein, partial [Chitinophagales bacterium]|nr:outer membrane beta-barrel protein [Chitinophagales bacterium]
NLTAGSAQTGWAAPAPPSAANPDTTIISIGKSIKIQVVDKNKKEGESVEVMVNSDNEKLSQEIERAVREALEKAGNVDVEMDINHQRISEQLQKANAELARAMQEIAEQMKGLDNDKSEEQKETRRELEAAQRELEAAQRELEREMRNIEGSKSPKTIRIEIKDEANAPKTQEPARNKGLSVKTRYLLFDMGVSTYLHDGSYTLPNNLEQFEQRYGRSLDYNLYAFKQKLSFAQKHLNLTYGLGFNFSNYSFENPITLQKNTNPLVVTIDESRNYRKNKLVTTFINVPVMVGFETNPRKPNKSIRLSGGVFGGALLGSHTRQKDKEDGNIKVRDDFNLN